MVILEWTQQIFIYLIIITYVLFLIFHNTRLKFVESEFVQNM